MTIAIVHVTDKTGAFQAIRLEESTEAAVKEKFAELISIEGFEDCRIDCIKFIELDPYLWRDEEIDNIISEMSSFSDLEGSEVGTYWSKLHDIWFDSSVSNELRKALKAEIVNCWLDFAYYRVSTTTYQPPLQVEKKLEYIG